MIEASFGATIYSAINANTRGYIRHLSTFGPGLCLNYWNDGNSAFNNYGSGFLAALQSMNLGSLRYPGGEKADSCAPTAFGHPKSLNNDFALDECILPCAAGPAHGCSRAATLRPRGSCATVPVQSQT